jgi:hypothetical protein
MLESYRLMSEWLQAQAEALFGTAEWAQRYNVSVLKGDWKAACGLVLDASQRVTKIRRETESLRRRAAVSLGRERGHAICSRSSRLPSRNGEQQPPRQTGEDKYHGHIGAGADHSE